MASKGSKTLAFIIGTRAQLIKVAPVVVACEKLGMSCHLVMTGQHRETMQDLLDEFGIASPQVAALEASEHSTVGSLLRWLPAAYRGVGLRLRLLGRSKSDVDVLVHGDTLSTLVGAAAGRRFGARIIHLESGLTSGKLFDPFPEEICRRLVFWMTDVAMCPNAQATKNMQRYSGKAVVDTGGNTILDAVALSGASPSDRNVSQPYLVASLHRFQNIYDRSRLMQLVALVEEISARFPVNFVLHPATQSRLKRDKLLERLAANPQVALLPRMGYGDFLRLAAHAACVLTDGGSNQEELAALGVPTIIMRSRTERPDGLGSNSIMEKEVADGVANFIRNDRFEQLRRTPAQVATEGPSDRIARFLAKDV